LKLLKIQVLQNDLNGYVAENDQLQEDNLVSINALNAAAEERLRRQSESLKMKFDQELSSEKVLIEIALLIFQ